MTANMNRDGSVRLRGAISLSDYDKKTKPGAKATRLLRQHMPFVNTWYAATAINRWVMDDL